MNSNQSVTARSTASDSQTPVFINFPFYGHRWVEISLAQPKVTETRIPAPVSTCTPGDMDRHIDSSHSSHTKTWINPYIHQQQNGHIRGSIKGINDYNARQASIVKEARHGIPFISSSGTSQINLYFFRMQFRWQNWNEKKRKQITQTNWVEESCDWGRRYSSLEGTDSGGLCSARGGYLGLCFKKMYICILYTFMFVMYHNKGDSFEDQLYDFVQSEHMLFPTTCLIHLGCYLSIKTIAKLWIYCNLRENLTHYLQAKSSL